MPKRRVVIGFIGTTMDAGKLDSRWERWRPTVALCQHEDMLVDRLELIHDTHSAALAKRVAADIQAVSPDTVVRFNLMNLRNAWDFQEVFAAMLDFARAYHFDTEDEEYLVNITTGTHVDPDLLVPADRGALPAGAAAAAGLAEAVGGGGIPAATTSSTSTCRATTASPPASRRSGRRRRRS